MCCVIRVRAAGATYNGVSMFYSTSGDLGPGVGCGPCGCVERCLWGLMEWRQWHGECAIMVRQCGVVHAFTSWDESLPSVVMAVRLSWHPENYATPAC
jgi:hypothetical protein